MEQIDSSSNNHWTIICSNCHSFSQMIQLVLDLPKNVKMAFYRSGRPHFVVGIEVWQCKEFIQHGECWLIRSFSFSRSGGLLTGIKQVLLIRQSPRRLQTRYIASHMLANGVNRHQLDYSDILRLIFKNAHNNKQFTLAPRIKAWPMDG